ncbi:MAG: SpoIIE family protein phosphatase [Candidatus Omnitrophica bacterium]|nr:SpoIIE family protein phosphatase [Candidatus Omnitrophota bacterium]
MRAQSFNDKDAKSRTPIKGYFGIREKYSLLTIFIVLVASFFIFIVITQFRRQIDYLTESAEKLTVASLYGQANKEAKSLVVTLAKSLAGPISSGELAQINELLRTVTQQRDVVYAYLFDAKGKVIDDGKTDSVLVGHAMEDDLTKRTLSSTDVLISRHGDILDAAMPIYIGNKMIGGLRVGFSNKRVKSDILREREIISSVIQKTSNNTLIFPIMISVTLALLGVFFSSRVTALLVKPILRLAESAREIGKGNPSLKVDIKSGDEMEELAHSFNQMAASLAKHEEELSVLHDSAKALTKNLELDVLINGGLNTIREIIKVSKGSIMLIKDGYLVVEGVFGWKPGEVVRKRSFTIGEGIAGLAAQRRASIMVNDVNNSPLFVREGQKVWRGCQNLLCIPMIHENQLKGVINIQDKLDGTPFSKTDLEYAEIIASSMAISLSNIELVQEKITKTRMEVELKTAEAVQKTLLPREDPSDDRIEFASFFDHANETGGDWFGYVADKERDRLAILIGDVSGHGASAALVTAAVNSFIKTLMILKEQLSKNGAQGNSAVSMRQELDRLCEPGNLLRLLNRIVLEIGQGQLVMSFFACYLDLRLMELHFANAGHNQPYLLRQEPSGADAASGDKLKLTILKASGPRLGDIEAPEFEEATIGLKKNDCIFWFTDGLVECENSEQEEFGDRRLEEVLKMSGSLSASQVKDSVVAAAYKFFDKFPIRDDIAFIVARIR